MNADAIFSRIHCIGAGDCWIWKGHITRYGYGRINRSPTKLAHVAVWELFRGPKPEGKDLHHVCENKACCNPAHLQLLTRSEHVLIEPRGNGRDKVTHCPKGHPYDKTNTGWNPRKNAKPFRYCKECSRQRYHQRKRHESILDQSR